MPLDYPGTKFTSILALFVSIFFYYIYERTKFPTKIETWVDCARYFLRLANSSDHKMN